jgi:nitroreductase
MNESPEMIAKKEALEQVQLALRRTALIYHYFCETLTDELGEKKGLELIRKAVAAYGAHIGRDAGSKARKKGLKLIPENYQDDLPEMAWESETVTIDGEERIRVHHCPLAKEWLEWGDAQKARLYCFVDQAKMHAFNPDYEYIHIKNILEGDPYCELVVRPVKKVDTDDRTGVETKSEDTVHWAFGRYTREDLMRMDPVCLRALFRERVHHTIEVHIYPILLGEKKIPPRFGRQVEVILNVWKQRGLPENDPDIAWGKNYLNLATKLREGREVTIDERIPAPFTQQEMATVRRLIWERRSVRNWIPGKKIPGETVEKILEAGRAAPTGCNLDIVRFVVIRDPEEAKMIWSDIPTPMDRCVLIVVGYDKRIYETVGHDRLVPHNRLYDCAAAADHMCLMAHALGLGAVWLTRTEKTGRTFKKKYGLPDYIEPALHIALGWPAMSTIKSARMPLGEMIITRKE